MHSGIRNVGAIDPELKTSPVAEEMLEESETLRLEVPGGAVCYFNGEVFKSGEIVRSGTTMLRCRDGIWVEAGPADPKNP
jgi:hypothetical protein